MASHPSTYCMHNRAVLTEQSIWSRSLPGECLYWARMAFPSSLSFVPSNPPLQPEKQYSFILRRK